MKSAWLTAWSPGIVSSASQTRSLHSGRNMILSTSDCVVSDVLLSELCGPPRFALSPPQPRIAMINVSITIRVLVSDIILLLSMFIQSQQAESHRGNRPVGKFSYRDV